MKTTQRILSVFLVALLLLMIAPVGGLASADPAYPDWAFDYTEKDGTVHHVGDAVTTKADHIKNSTLSLLYSGEGLNALFESLYADMESKATRNAIWHGGEAIDTGSAYVYLQGLPMLFQYLLPLEPMFFHPSYEPDIKWYNFFDGSRLPKSYPHVYSALYRAKVFRDQAGLWSSALLMNHKTDVSFWRVPDDASLDGTKARVPIQHSNSHWPASSTFVDSFLVDSDTEVVDWSLMKEVPQVTWQLDANQPETLYSALAACCCGYASVINTFLTGNYLTADCETAISNLQMEAEIAPVGYKGDFYTKLLQPLYEALDITDYPSLETLAADAAVGQYYGKGYSFGVNNGLNLFRDIMAPIVDWVENVLFADPVNVLANVAPAVSALLDLNDPDSIFNQEAVRLNVSVSSYKFQFFTMCYKDVFEKVLGLLDLDSALGAYQQCNAEGHAWDSGVVTAATCAAQGTKLFTCTRCGATRTDPIPINKANHVHPSNVAASEPTATAHGYTAGVYCADCDTWLSGHDVIHNRLGAQTVIQAPTETKEGVMDIVCTVCGAHGQYPIEKLPHSGGNDFWKWLRDFIDWLLQLFGWLG